MNHYIEMDSPIGSLLVTCDDDGITGLRMDTPGRPGIATMKRGHPLLTRARKQLNEYFAGKRTEFDLPLTPQGTDFQCAVWKRLERIPFGRTKSYGEIASEVGKPKASRAVGAANGRNPISVIVPCHRVIGSNGTLTGFGGGLERKQWLLQHESA